MLRTGLREKIVIVTAFVSAFLAVFSAVPVRAMNGDFCFCRKDISVIKPETVDQYSKEKGTFWQSGCSIVTDFAECNSIKTLGGYDTCDAIYPSDTACNDAKTIFETDLDKRFKDARQEGLAATKSTFIPDCALQDDLTAECKDVSIFVILAINIANYMFSIIGALALLVFVYGGFRLILSQGNAEQIDAGKNAMVAAVTGLAVAFGGYLLIQFASQIVGVTTPLL